MNLSFDEATKEALSTSLKEKNKSAVRIVIEGFGWGGPSFGIVLDEQNNEDEVAVVDGIKIVADKEFSFLFDNVKIVSTKGPFGTSFHLVSKRFGNGSC